MEDFSTEHLGVIIPAEKNDGEECYQNLWLERMKGVIEALNIARGFYIRETDPELKKDYWWQMIQLLPSSYNQTRNVMLNYEVLANIYKSRHNHKLDCWRDFCAWIETLPYSELICGEEAIMTPNEQREKLEEVADKFCEIGNINPLSKEEIEQSVNLSRIKEN